MGVKSDQLIQSGISFVTTGPIILNTGYHWPCCYKKIGFCCFKKTVKAVLRQPSRSIDLL